MADETKPVEETLKSDTEEPVNDDTATDTPEGDTDTETSDELMEELGLSGKYKTREDALRSIPYAQKALQDAQKDAAEMRRFFSQLVTSKNEPAPLSKEELEEQFQFDPIGTIREKGGLVKKEEVGILKDKIAKLENERFFNRLSGSLRKLDGFDDICDYLENSMSEPPPGMNPKWDAVWNTYLNDSRLHGADQSAILPMIAEMLYGKKAIPTSKGNVTVPDGKKNRANTATSRPHGGSEETPDFSKMSPEEIKAWTIKNRPDLIGRT